MDGEMLLDRAGRGDRDAFLTLMEPLEPQVYRQILERTGDPDRALDLTLQTFLRAWHGIGLFQKDEPLEDWLRRILEDVCRKEKPAKDPAPAAEVPAMLHQAVSNTIEQEGKRYGVPAMLSRLRFTILAAVIALALLLFSRCSDPGKAAASPSPTPVPSGPVLDVDAELHPR